MPRTERIREAFDRPLDLSYLRERERAGWRLVGLEWERDLEGDDARAPKLLKEAPFGSQVSGDCEHLEENLPDMQFLY